MRGQGSCYRIKTEYCRRNCIKFKTYNNERFSKILDVYFTGSDVDDTQRKNIRHKRDAWYQRHKVGAIIIFMTDRCFIIQIEIKAPINEVFVEYGNNRRISVPRYKVLLFVTVPAIMAMNLHQCPTQLQIS